ncbi:MAG: hypothetical protein ABSB96_01395 [Gaiellaceae bacterium]
MLPYEDYRTNQANVRARLAALTGLIGVVLAPAAIVLSMRLVEVTLIMAVIAIAAGCSVFGILALVLAKRARLRRSISLGRMGGAKLAGLGRLLGTLALSLGLAACVALAVYAIMTSR